jgi:hypothetical protein
MDEIIVFFHLKVFESVSVPQNFFARFAMQMQTLK